MPALENGVSGLTLNPHAGSYTPGANGSNSFGDHQQVVAGLMDRLCAGGPDAVKAAEEIALMVLGSGVTSLDTFGFAPQLRAAAEDAGAPTAREGAMLAYK